MEKKQFEMIIKNKTPEELHRIISRSCNGLLHLTNKQVERCIVLKNRLLKEKRIKYAKNS